MKSTSISEFNKLQGAKQKKKNLSQPKLMQFRDVRKRFSLYIVLTVFST